MGFKALCIPLYVRPLSAQDAARTSFCISASTVVGIVNSNILIEVVGVVPNRFSTTPFVLRRSTRLLGGIHLDH